MNASRVVGVAKTPAGNPINCSGAMWSIPVGLEVDILIWIVVVSLSR